MQGSYKTDRLKPFCFIKTIGIQYTQYELQKLAYKLLRFLLFKSLIINQFNYFKTQLLMKNKSFKISRRTGFLVLMMLFSGLFANTLLAQTSYTWVAGTVGDWSNSANWSPVGVPGVAAGDSVTINDGSCTLDITPANTIASATVGATASTIGKLIIASTRTLTLSNATVASLVISGGKIENAGTLTVNASAAITPVTLPATLNKTVGVDWGYSGAGALNLNFSTTTTTFITCSGLFDDTITNGSIPVLAFNAATTAITAGSTNRIFCNVATNTKIKIGGTGFTITNPAAMSTNIFTTAAGSSIEILSGATVKQVGNTATAVLAINMFGGSFINRGTVDLSGLFSGGLRFAGGTCIFDNYGTFKSAIALAGMSVQNTPIVTINNRNGALIDINGGASFSIQFSAPSAYAITFNNEIGATMNLVVTGSSGMSLNNTTFTNAGTINTGSGFGSNNATYPMTLFTNALTGIINMTGTGLGGAQTIGTFGTFTNNGVVNAGINARPATFINSNFTSGTLSPGGETVGGDIRFTAPSTVSLGSTKLRLNISGTAFTALDKISATVAGGGFDITNATLDVTGIYIPVSGLTITVITANATGTLTGNFASVIGLPSGWSVAYTTGIAGTVRLVYATPIANTPLWNGATSISWTDATNWTPNVVPDQNSDVTIAAAANQPTISTNVNINSLTIASGATLTVTAPNLTVTGAIANSGTMTLANNSNLIQGIATVTNSNTGNMTVNRNSNALSRLDFTSWSSPVTNAGQFLTTFSPLTSTNRFYNYSETANQYTEILSPSTITFDAGAGYLIRMPNTAVAFPATQTFAGVFTGVPNNGTITKAITYNGSAPFGYNMVGNPYPSTIDADAFITANTAVIENSLYFWRKINGATGSAYAVYTKAGATTATPSSALPNGTIQVGQGFFVKAKSASNVTFTNAMRVANNQNQFFKTKQVAQKDRVWLNLTNASGAFSQALVGYFADATSGVDVYDGKYINDSPIALTWNINNEEYTIQGRPAFDATDVVALNFKTDVAGDYTIAIDQAEGVLGATQEVYLVDSKTGTETDLKTGAYTFTTAVGTDNARFSLKYQKTLKVGAATFNENSISVYKNNGTLYVNSGAIAISNIKVFDVQGRLLTEQRNVKTTTATINDLKAVHQVLIVKIFDADNNEVTKKVMN